MKLDDALVAEVQQSLRRVTDCWDAPCGEEFRLLRKLARKLDEAVAKATHECVGLGVPGLAAHCPVCYDTCGRCGGRMGEPEEDCPASCTLCG